MVLCLSFRTGPAPAPLDGAQIQPVILRPAFERQENAPKENSRAEDRGGPCAPDAASTWPTIFPRARPGASSPAPWLAAGDGASGVAGRLSSGEKRVRGRRGR
ncbi:hypothetical protein GCM10020220_055890 [Nonomuraea rubra]